MFCILDVLAITDKVGTASALKPKLMTTLKEHLLKEVVSIGKVGHLVCCQTCTCMHSVKTIQSLLCDSVASSYQSLGSKCKHVGITEYYPVNLTSLVSCSRILAILNWQRTLIRTVPGSDSV